MHICNSIIFFRDRCMQIEEFSLFIQSLNPSSLSKEEKSIINLIYENFSIVSSKTSLSKGEWGNRWDVISDLIIKNIEKEYKDLPSVGTWSKVTTAGSKDSKKLKEITLENFRWFSDEHTIIFNDHCTLIYWLNGSWKSSFNEALEYTLTGDIKEASQRSKWQTLKKYTTNIYTGKQKDPKLVFKDWTIASHNIEAYRFCFIEKNRINEFVKSSNAQEALEKLFGYWEFNRFIAEFNNNIDNNLLKDNITNEERETADKLKALEWIKTQSEANLKLKLDDLTSGCKECNLEFDPDKLDIIESYIQTEKNKAFQETVEKQVSDQVQEKVQELEKEIPIISTNKKLLPQIIIWAVIFIIAIGLAYFINKWFLLLIIIIFLLPKLFSKHVNSSPPPQPEQIANKVVEKEEAKEMPKVVDEKILLLEKKLLTYKTHKDAYEESLKALSDYTNNTRPLIDSLRVKQEKNEELKKYSTAYWKVLSLLKQYIKDKTESWVLKKALEWKTLEIFSYLLGEDGIKKLPIKTISLPSKGDEKIKITLQDDKEIDPLMYLSEGNLRCLWLSILLAKVIIDDLPFVICDDIVNAIDHWFRANICKCFFDIPWREDRQVVISTHSERFKDAFKSIVEDKKCTHYIFYSAEGNKIIIDGEGSTLLAQAEVDLSKGKIIDGLAKCRKALEGLIERITRDNIKTRIRTEALNNRSIDTSTKLGGLIQWLKALWTEYSSLVDNFWKILTGNPSFIAYLNEASHGNTKVLEDIELSEATPILTTLKAIDAEKNISKKLEKKNDEDKAT